MAKTNELSFTCSKAEVVSHDGRVVMVTIDEPDIETILMGIHTDDLIEYVQRTMGVDEVYSQSELEKWAESEGYIKGETKD
jgi:hypothetical protein